MNTLLKPSQINFYRENGFVIQDDFLNTSELEQWRQTFDAAVAERRGLKIPNTAIFNGQNDGINKDTAYFGKVFDQLVNLWQTHPGMKRLILDHRIGEMAATLAGVDRLRVWHDQALIKKPWANPTALHLDTPFWSFDSGQSISIWIALDDATVQNGCLYFIPGSHRQTKYASQGISQNVGFIFEEYTALAGVPPFVATMKAGSASFHNGMCIHGAGPNMTTGYRRAMTCAFMPDGSVFNGKKNILPDAYFDSLRVGDALRNDIHNPLVAVAEPVR